MIFQNRRAFFFTTSTHILPLLLPSMPARYMLGNQKRNWKYVNIFSQHHVEEFEAKCTALMYSHWFMFMQPKLMSSLTEKCK